VPDLSFGRLRPVLDLGQKLRLYPDALAGDPLGVGLRLAVQRLQPLLQVRRRGLVEAVVNFAGVDQIVSLAPADVDAIPFAFVEREVCDG